MSKSSRVCLQWSTLGREDMVVTIFLQSIGLSPDVLFPFAASGQGIQTKMCYSLFFLFKTADQRAWIIILHFFSISVHSNIREINLVLVQGSFFRCHKREYPPELKTLDLIILEDISSFYPHFNKGLTNLFISEMSPNNFSCKAPPDDSESRVTTRVPPRYGSVHQSLCHQTAESTT